MPSNTQHHTYYTCMPHVHSHWHSGELALNPTSVKFTSIFLQKSFQNLHKTKSCKCYKLCPNFDKFDFMVLEKLLQVYTSWSKQYANRMWTCIVLGIWVADIEKAGLKNGWEITTKKCFKQELSKAIENNIKEANEPTELSKHL
jgi:hypothetical protein